MSADHDLLKEFVENHSQEAFSALVQRHVHLVHSAALRQLGGDAHLAWDASQGVFLAFAQSASRLLNHTALTGWFYTTTRFVCAKLVRTRQRARAREVAASTMNEILHEGSVEPDWSAVRPVLDATMHELTAVDREALLLRYFEGCSFVEIGRQCRLGENAARMRVERAMEKLRGRFARRGITSTAVALGTVLTAHGVGTAPAGLASAAATLAFAGTTATATGAGGTLVWLKLMNATQLKVGAATAVCALVIGSYIGAEWRQPGRSAPDSTAATQRREIAVAREANARTEPNRPLATAGNPAGSSAASSAIPTNAAEDAVVAAAQKALSASARSGLDQRYGGLFRRLKLTPGDLEKLRDLLTERQLSSFDTIAVAQSQGIQFAANPAELKAAMNKVRADVDENIRAFLGDERYPLYQEFTDNASSYALLELIERRLSYTDAPLQNAQADALRRILVAAATSNPEQPPSAHGPLAGIVEPLAGSDPLIAAMSQGPVSDQTIAQAQTILAPAQIEILRQIQSEQLRQREALQALGRWPPGVVTDGNKPAVHPRVPDTKK